MNENLKKALRATSEANDIEFKSSFDVDSKKEWVSRIKDIVAITNSGGGVIVFGLNSVGEPTGKDIGQILNLDPAKTTDKIYSYTTNHFSDFELVECKKNSLKLAALIVQGTKVPLVFTRPGTYQKPDGEQRSEFALGTVYFRHGAKSEPATPDDIREVIERRLEEIRHQWLSGVRRVVQAPEGSKMAVLPPEVKQSSSPEAMPIRIVNDPEAPGYRIIDPNVTHPYRFFEFVEELQSQLPEFSFNQWDLLAIRRVHNIDRQNRFFYQPKSGSSQYSIELRDWIIEKCLENPNFLIETREKYYKIRY